MGTGRCAVYENDRSLFDRKVETHSRHEASDNWFVITSKRNSQRNSSSVYPYPRYSNHDARDSEKAKADIGPHFNDAGITKDVH